MTVKCIAAIDSKRGIADDHGIPWQGLIPSDVKYYRQKLKSDGLILMGYGVYRELSKPYAGGINYVASRNAIDLRPGFELVRDAREFITNAQADIWNVGGAQLFASTFDLADELYLTLIDGDFGCTKFFPPYKDEFEMISSSEPLIENDVPFRFTIWQRKTFTKQG